MPLAMFMHRHPNAIKDDLEIKHGNKDRMSSRDENVYLNEGNHCTNYDHDLFCAQEALMNVKLTARPLEMCKMCHTLQ